MNERFNFTALADNDSHRILIEASAGTGKTYTIERIVLYYLLAPGFRFSLSEILIVTFTNKATREIRGRLRKLIRSSLNIPEKAAELFAELTLGDPAAARNEGWRGHLARELRLFARAPVYTIHGFCQSILTRYPLELGSLFGTKINQAVNSEALTDLFRGLLAEGSIQSLPGDPEGSGEIAGFMLTLVVDAAKRVFRQPGSFELFDSLSRYVVSGLFDSERYLYPAPESAGVARVWAELTNRYPEETTSLLAGRELEPQVALGIRDLLIRLEPTLLEGGEGPNTEIDAADIVRRCAAFELLRRVSGLYGDYKASHTTHQSRLSYDDLVNTVARGVRENPKLVERLKNDYKSVLIDEFQDTDGAQWEIFNSIAGDRIIAVGDPKQAIYAFRGADLNTYLRAKKSFDRHFALDTNFRSSSRLVAAGNAMFESLFAQSLGTQSLEFSPVRPGVKAHDSWRILGPGDKSLPILRFTKLEAESASGLMAARITLIDAICSQIAELGNGSYRVGSHSTPGPSGSKVLGWSDQAVLVQSHTEARTIAEKLAVRGIPATLQGQAKLMETLEADEIASFLSAVESPWRRSKIHEALLTRVFGLSVGDLDAAISSGQVANYNELFFAWHRSYAYKGLHRIFAEASEKNLSSLAAAEGQRFLRTHTNYRHIIDITASAFALDEVPAARLAEAFAVIRNDRYREDEPSLRLDRDSPAVRIMTMHSSKGLEFPVVHILAGLKESETKRQGPGSRPFSVTGIEAAGSVWRSFDPFMSESGRASEAALAWDEWLRLFYVSVTRAQAFVNVPYIPRAAGKVRDSLLAALYESKAIDPEKLSNQLGHDCEIVAGEKYADRWKLVEKAEPASGDSRSLPETVAFQPGTLIEQLRQQITLPQKTRQGWHHPLYPPTGRQSSFTSIVSSIHAADQSRAIAEAGFGEQRDSSRKDDADQEAAPSPEPAGADFGTLFHLAMEHIDLSADDSNVETQRVISETVAPRALGMSFGANYPNFTSIRAFFSTIVGAAASLVLPGGIALRELPASEVLRELVFNASVPQTANVTALPQASWFSGFTLGAGFVTGSIDMAFRALGRWHIIDWKTNLVPEGRVDQVMDDNGYRLQALIYQSALHQSLCAQAGFKWNPAAPGSGIGTTLLTDVIQETQTTSESRAKDLFNREIGKVWYIFVRELAKDPELGIFDATPGWDQVWAFQKQGGLYTNG